MPIATTIIVPEPVAGFRRSVNNLIGTQTWSTLRCGHHHRGQHGEQQDAAEHQRVVLRDQQAVQGAVEQDWRGGGETVGAQGLGDAVGDGELVFNDQDGLHAASIALFCQTGKKA
jgi:hypothetical protein